MTQQSSDMPPATSSLPGLSLYQRVTDKVSYAQGTPANLTFWLIAIGLWFIRPGTGARDVPADVGI